MTKKLRFVTFNQNHLEISGIFLIKNSVCYEFSLRNLFKRLNEESGL